MWICYSLSNITPVLGEENLEYGGTFTKLFMHVSSRNMFPTTRNRCKSECMFINLAIVVETD